LAARLRARQKGHSGPAGREGDGRSSSLTRPYRHTMASFDPPAPPHGRQLTPRGALWGAKQSNSYLPFKVNSAGVMPIIFASSLLAAPAGLARFANSEALEAGDCPIEFQDPMQPIETPLKPLLNLYRGNQRRARCTRAARCTCPSTSASSASSTTSTPSCR
jgi:hypothetical protein